MHSQNRWAPTLADCWQRGAVLSLPECLASNPSLITFIFCSVSVGKYASCHFKSPPSRSRCHLDRRRETRAWYAPWPRARQLFRWHAWLHREPWRSGGWQHETRHRGRPRWGSVAPCPRKSSVSPHTAEAESSSTAPPLLHDSLMGTSNPEWASELYKEMDVSDISTRSKEEATRKRDPHLNFGNRCTSASTKNWTGGESGCWIKHPSSITRTHRKKKTLEPDASSAHSIWEMHDAFSTCPPRPRLSIHELSEVLETMRRSAIWARWIQHFASVSRCSVFLVCLLGDLGPHQFSGSPWSRTLRWLPGSLEYYIRDRLRPRESFILSSFTFLRNHFVDAICRHRAAYSYGMGSGLPEL